MKSLFVFALMLGCVGCGKAIPAPESNPTDNQSHVSAKGTVANPAPKKQPQEVLRAQVEKLAVAEEAAAKSEAPKYLAKAQEENAADRAAYKFKVARWGDWLEVSIARLDYEKKIDKYSTSINLQLVTTIHLESGHGPDSEGVLDYKLFEADDVSKDNDRIGESGCDNGYLDPPRKGYHWKIVPQYPTPENHHMFEETPQQNANTIMMSQNWGGGVIYCGAGISVSYRTEHFPRYSEDDVIRFDGIAVLYVPAGKGEEVYRQILGAKDQP